MLRMLRSVSAAWIPLALLLSHAQAQDGGGFGKLFRLGQLLAVEGNPLGKLLINAQLAAYGNFAKPEFGPDCQLRFQIQFFFPK